MPAVEPTIGGERSFELLVSAEQYLEASELSNAQFLRKEISPEARALQLVKLATVSLDKTDEASAMGFIQQVLQMPEVSEEAHSKARLLWSRIHLNYGDRISWQKVIDACRRILGSEGVSGSTRTQAKELLVPALLGLSQYSEARELLDGLRSDEMLSPYERARHGMSLSRLYLLDRECARARSILAGMLGPDEGGRPYNLFNNEDRAEFQLLWGVSYFEEGDNERALIELARVPGMPGQSSDSPQTREALVRLRVRKLVREDFPSMKVLFIGSSHTLRGNVPLLVEKIAASAPEGWPRISAAEHIRTGTGMRTFWDEGTALHAARGKIVAESWDAVVIETFFRYPTELMERYTGYYAELVQGRGAKLVLYESPVLRTTSYPEGFNVYHRENIRLGRMFGAAVAPSVSAWMHFVGERPSADALSELYADHIHATIKGAYMTACCLYSALTGCSPLERFHPQEISPEESLLLQSASWEAFRHTEREALR